MGRCSPFACDRLKDIYARARSYKLWSVPPSLDRWPTEFLSVVLMIGRRLRALGATAIGAPIRITYLAYSPPLIQRRLQCTIRNGAL